ncbi:hypothetical protein P691DRAFT_467200 [Macrolepiota fuliginosa MF-IS2]|uniref:F-box domain-containing protein n=1 Tax=Macrolepiota fuliginosa MF-IS2 TaxID=1400762 RepID=A0A9P5X3C3_9AGAR|nr:hypothetical protein P691DRAFT_467200 [Macrolepiota fuliginosa MF-IS2]
MTNLDCATRSHTIFSQKSVSPWSTTKSPVVALPPEILDEILSYLGVESLLSLRRTCRILQKATSSRYI